MSGNRERPRALDLFCGAGGASVGLERAGFEVTGVDIKPQPRYRGGAFVQGDALTFPLEGYDFIWASPPCQRYSMYSRNLGVAHRHPDLIGPIRERLVGAAGLTCIENVEGAPLRPDLFLCGTMFDLPLIRHRLFELNFQLSSLTRPCQHLGLEIPVYGKGTPQWHRERFGRNVRAEEQRAAMGIGWMTRDELVEAVPPAYAEFIGRQALSVLRQEAVA